MIEILYEAQQYFPSKCTDCPMLVGLIEDGIISPNEVSPSEVMEVVREQAREYNFETCPGTIRETDGREVITTCAATFAINNKEVR